MTKSTTPTKCMKTDIDIGGCCRRKHRSGHLTVRRAGQACRAAIGVFFLTAPVVLAQGNYQWTMSRSGNYSIEGISTSPTSPAIVIAVDDFHISRSANAGGSWISASYNWVPTDGEIAFDPANPLVVYAACWYGLLKSTDGGSNWFALPTIHAGSTSAVVIDPSNTNIVYAGGRSGWGVYKSVNGGATWSNPLSSRDVQDIAIDPVSPQIVFAGTKGYYSQSGGILRSTDGGQTWTAVWPFGDINALAVDPSNPQVVYAGAESGDVLKSTNGGFTWAVSGNAPSNSPVSTLIIDSANTGLVYASTKGNGVFVSPDAGATWTSINFGLTDPNCLCMTLHSPSGLLFVGTYSGSVFVGVPQQFPASATSFGLGCGSPALTLAPSPTALPRINTTSRASMANAPTMPAFVSLGWSNTAAGPFSLPMPLVLYGMTGCNLLQSAELGSQPATPTGAATAIYSLPLPNWAGLLGLRVYLQGWAVAPGANAANVIVSNGVEWVIGT